LFGLAMFWLFGLAARLVIGFWYVPRRRFRTSTEADPPRQGSW
jgi:hypothetical protein